MESTHASDSDELVTAAEAARIAHMSPDTIRRYADKGILPSFRTPANHRRFKLIDVRNLITPSRAAS